MSFLNQLRKRRVPQVAGIYMVVGFGVLEAADIAFPRLGLPDWSVTLVLALLLAGLPVAVVLAWAYDVTSEGVRRTAEADAAATPALATDRVKLGLVAVAGIALLGAAGWFATGRSIDPLPLSNEVAVVPPFRVSGGEGAAYLDEGMVDLLAAKLTGEGGLRTMEPRAVLAAWAAGDQAAPEHDRAVRVARRLGAGRVILGSVVATGDQLHIAGRVLATASGGELARHEVQGLADSLPALVDRFAAGLLGQLAGVDEGRLQRLEDTPLPALRSYLDGQAALRAGSFSSAVTAFERAMAHDSTFALAGMLHNIAASFTSQWSDEGLELAWRHRDRLSSRDQLVLQAWLGPNYPDWTPRQQSLAALDRATREITDRAELWYIRGDEILHYDTGAPLPERLDHATRLFSEAMRLDPNFGPALIHLLEIALLQGDTATARQHASSFLAAHPMGDLAHYVHWFHQQLTGERPEPPQASDEYSLMRVHAGVMAAEHGFGLSNADTLVEWGLSVAAEGDELLFDALASYMLDRGRPQRSHAIHSERLGRSPAASDAAAVYSALYWETGAQPPQVRAAVERLEKQAEARRDHNDIQWHQAACVAAQYRAASAEWERARSHARDLRGSLDPDTSAPGPARRYRLVCAALVEAMAAVEGGDGAATPGSAGDPDRAIERLERFHTDSWTGDAWLRDATSLVLARLYESRGDVEHALDIVQRRVVAVPRHHFMSTQLREYGRLAARLGRTAEAAAAYRHYLALRADPEPAVRSAADQVRVDLARLMGSR